MRLKNNFSSLFLILTFVSFSSCNFSEKVIANSAESYTVMNGSVPADFMKDESTMILIYDKDDTVEGHYMKDAFAKHYKGKTVYITKKEMKGEEYQDLEEFRYMLYSKSGDTYSNSNGNGYTQRRFFIYDRLEKKEYANEYNNGYYAKYLEGCAMGLEKVRASNQN